MDSIQATKIVERVADLPLYLHAYAFHLNMRMEKILPEDLLNIASKQHLKGVKIHVVDGESQSLRHANDERLARFAAKAHQLELDVHIETSASDAATIDEAVQIALKSGATSVRFYPRYEGTLSDVMETIAKDIQYIKAQYQHSGLTFTLEQHEDLQSHELVQLVQQADFPQLSLLFDFANMINANEEPLDALAVMGNEITQVHIKDALITHEGEGRGHTACISGQGELPFKELLLQLICLGENKPQVTAFGLEEEVDYYAPAFRFTDEDSNPWIPLREMSETPLPTYGLDERLNKEIVDAINQIRYVRNILSDINKDAVNVIQK
ncbi:sugar phosphate isomerase/epimerase family protein [Buttiauxella noackiae]|uniref:sugar phosphate isomerase/epimerase family protein n=1 Tax=Buttiauxella noackiae TaxID=82992 RepID=UPI0035A61B84